MPITSLRQDVPAQGQVQVQQVQVASAGVLPTNVQDLEQNSNRAKAVGGLLGAWLESKVNKTKQEEQLKGAGDAALSKVTGDATAMLGELQSNMVDKNFPDVYAAGYTGMAAQNITQNFITAGGKAVQAAQSPEKFQDWVNPAAFKDTQVQAATDKLKEFTSLPGTTPELLQNVQATLMRGVQQSVEDYGTAYNKRFYAESNASHRTMLAQQTDELLAAATVGDMPSMVRTVAALASPVAVLKDTDQNANITLALQRVKATLDAGDYTPQAKLKVTKALFAVYGKATDSEIFKVVDQLRTQAMDWNATVADTDLDQVVASLNAGASYKLSPDSLWAGVNMQNVQDLQVHAKKLYDTGEINQVGFNRLMAGTTRVYDAQLKAITGEQKAKLVLTTLDDAGRATLSLNHPAIGLTLLSGQGSAVVREVKAFIAKGGGSGSELGTWTQIINEASPVTKGVAVHEALGVAEASAKELDAALTSSPDAVTFARAQQLLIDTQRIRQLSGSTAAEPTVHPALAKLRERLSAAGQGVPWDKDYTANAAKNYFDQSQQAQRRTDVAKSEYTPDALKRRMKAFIGTDFGIVANRLTTALQTMVAHGNLTTFDEDVLPNFWRGFDNSVGSGIFLPPEQMLSFPGETTGTRTKAVVTTVVQAATQQSRLDQSEADDLEASILRGEGNLRVGNQQLRARLRVLPDERGTLQLEYLPEGSQTWTKYGVGVLPEATVTTLRNARAMPRNVTGQTINGRVVADPQLAYLYPGVKLDLPHTQVEQKGVMNKIEGVVQGYTSATNATLAAYKLNTAGMSDQTRLGVSKVVYALGGIATTAGLLNGNNAAKANAAAKAMLDLARKPNSSAQDIDKVVDLIVGPQLSERKAIRTWIKTTAYPLLTGSVNDLQALVQAK